MLAGDSKCTVSATPNEQHDESHVPPRYQRRRRVQLDVRVHRQWADDVSAHSLDAGAHAGRRRGQCVRAAAVAVDPPSAQPLRADGAVAGHGRHGRVHDERPVSALVLHRTIHGIHGHRRAIGR